MYVDIIQKPLVVFIVTFKREVHTTVYAFLIFHMFVKYLQGRPRFFLAMLVYSRQYNHNEGGNNMKSAKPILWPLAKI